MPACTRRRRCGRFTSSSASSGWSCEARRLAAAAGEGPNATTARKQIVSDVTALRHAGEMKSYIDLLFLALVILLCIAKIVTN